MNPDAAQLWRAPRWALAVLLAVLGMLGPFSVDTYIPAFSSIDSASSLRISRDGERGFHRIVSSGFAGS